MNRRLPAAVTLGLAALVTFFPLARPRAQQQAEPLGVAWERRVPSVVGLAISPEGSRVAAIDTSGKVECFDGVGELLWAASAPGARQVAMAGLGRRVAAWTSHSAMQTRVALFGLRGAALPPMEVGGPIGSLSLSADGTQVAAGTETGIRWVSSAGRGRRAGFLLLPGPAAQVLPGPARTFYAALRGSGGALRVRRDGRVLWQAARPDASATVIASPPVTSPVTSKAEVSEVSQVGQVLGLAEALPADRIRLEVRRGDGTTAWSSEWPGRLPRLKLVADGAVLVLSYEQPEPHGSRMRYEHRVAYFRTDASPLPRWATGGAYSGASFFAAAAPDGSYVVSLDQEPRSGGMALRMMDAGGAKLTRYVLPGPVRIAVSSQDGSRLVVYRADGTLAMIHVR